MRLVVLVVVILAVLAQTAYAAYCSGSPDPGERSNSYPIFDGKLRHIKSVKNGMLFEAGPPGAKFPLVHLWGTPYEVGFAQGELIKPTLVEFITKTWAYLDSELAMAVNGGFLPDWAKIMIANEGMTSALDWTIGVTGPFTSQDYIDEMKGMADATGLSFDMVYRLNMFPELSKAQCSFFGAWGTAVREKGHAFQLRALDFDTTGPFKDFPQVTVYHPAQGNAWAQVGFPGSIGVLTGFSQQQLGISEIGVYWDDDSFGQGTKTTGPEKVKGEPWMFVLRDVLQFESDLAGARQRITESERTCNLIIGVGSGKDQMVNGCEYSGVVANFYSDADLLPVNETWHAPIENVVYNGMDWNCPGYNQVLGDQLKKYRGNIDELVTVQNILPTTQTGNLHAAVYDLVEQTMHVSFCRTAAADASEPLYAYERQFTRLHMKDIFAQQPPTEF